MKYISLHLYSPRGILNGRRPLQLPSGVKDGKRPLAPSGLNDYVQDICEWTAFRDKSMDFGR